MDLSNNCEIRNARRVYEGRTIVFCQLRHKHAIRIKKFAVESRIMTDYCRNQG